MRCVQVEDYKYRVHRRLSSVPVLTRPSSSTSTSFLSTFSMSISVTLLLPLPLRLSRESRAQGCMRQGRWDDWARCAAAIYREVASVAPDLPFTVHSFFWLFGFSPGLGAAPRHMHPTQASKKTTPRMHACARQICQGANQCRGVLY